MVDLSYFAGELGSYTPSKVGNTYQLGTYALDMSNKVSPKPDLKKQGAVEEYIIEDYLRPDHQSTTWSNEIGADILF